MGSMREGAPHSERGVHFMGPGKRASLLNGSELSRYILRPTRKKSIGLKEENSNAMRDPQLHAEIPFKSTSPAWKTPSTGCACVRNGLAHFLLPSLSPIPIFSSELSEGDNYFAIISDKQPRRRLTRVSQG